MTRRLELRFFKRRLWNVQERSLSLRKYFKYFSSDEMLRCWWHFLGGSFGTLTKKKIVKWVISRFWVPQLFSFNRPSFCSALRGLCCLRAVNCVRNTAWRKRKQTQNCAALPYLWTRADIFKCVNHRNLRGLRFLRLNVRPALTFRRLTSTIVDEPHR